MENPVTAFLNGGADGQGLAVIIGGAVPSGPTCDVVLTFAGTQFNGAFATVYIADKSTMLSLTPTTGTNTTAASVYLVYCPFISRVGYEWRLCDWSVHPERSGPDRPFDICRMHNRSRR